MSQTEILKAIRKNKTFLISTHVNPDADALSSQLALAMYLKSLGKKVHVINTDHMPERFMFLPGSHMVEKVNPKKRLNYDVAIAVDCGDLSRIDRVKDILLKDMLIINIDHHITNDHFGHLNLVNPVASSTAEVLFDLFVKAGYKITKPVAMLLYLGIMTDTGSFRFDSTTAHTHRVVGELMKLDFSVSELYRRIYERVSLKDLKHFTQVVNQFDTFHKGRVVSITLMKNTMAKFSEEFDLRDKIFTFLRAIKGVEVIVVFSEHRKGATRVNFRSQGNSVNVAQLASFFGGGGHRKASGCVIEGDIPSAKRKLFAKLGEVL